MENEELILVKNDDGIEFYLSPEYNEEDLKRTQLKSVEMMSVIVSIFENHDIDYILAHGTLLGLIRHNDFIPWDDDCDLFVFEWDYARAIELLRRELPEDMIVHNRRTDPIYWPKWTKIRDLYSDTYESLWKIDRKFRFHGICVDILKVIVVDKNTHENADEIRELERRISRREKKYKQKTGFSALKALPRYLVGKSIDSGKLRQLNSEGKSEEKLCIGNPETVIECSFDYKDVFPVKKMVFRGVEVAVPNNPDGVLRSMYGDYMKLPALEDRKPHFDKVIFYDRDEKGQSLEKTETEK
jgi:lipopolysaccharide cholinephosphotransferase